MNKENLELNLQDCSYKSLFSLSMAIVFCVIALILFDYQVAVAGIFFGLALFAIIISLYFKYKRNKLKEELMNVHKGEKVEPHSMRL